MSDLDQYDYDLPAELIAQHPLRNRSDARLLTVDRSAQSLAHHHVRALPELLRKGDCLVFNDTRVIAARLIGRRTATGGRWSGLFLRVDGEGNWLVLGKTRGKLQPGETITLEDAQAQPAVRLQLVMRREEGIWAMRPDSSQPLTELLNRVGRVPLPPYIRQGEMEPTDREAYQTVYSRNPGAVAAPTAGLHFTKELLEQLDQAGIQQAWVTLHVGLGTFRPIAADSLDKHRLHSEWCSAPAETVATIDRTRQNGGRVIAVGTTVVRVLETAASSGQLEPWEGETELFIRPGFSFRVIDGLLTNFHLPRSTLLVLVRSFGGDELLRRAYAEAVAERYRFYSYGDAMLIL